MSYIEEFGIEGVAKRYGETINNVPSVESATRNTKNGSGRN
jgi:hypothetical protein